MSALGGKADIEPPPREPLSDLTRVKLEPSGLV